MISIPMRSTPHEINSFSIILWTPLGSKDSRGTLWCPLVPSDSVVLNDVVLSVLPNKTIWVPLAPQGLCNVSDAQ